MSYINPSVSLSQSIFQIIKQKHQSFDEERVKLELKEMLDYDVIGDIWKIYTKANKEKKVGDTNFPNSLTAYLLGFTSAMPSGDFKLEKRRTYGRKGFPDIDMDFDYYRRHEIEEYLIQKYGSDNVGNIGTLQTLKTKAALRRAIKTVDPEHSIVFDASGKPIKNDSSTNFQLQNEILSSFPDVLKREDGTFIGSVSEAYEEYPDFAKYMDKYPDVYKYAKRLEGTIAAFGVHPAGKILSPIPLKFISPMHVTQGVDGSTKDRTVSTQFSMSEIELLGLIKLDVLGLSTKTAVHLALKLIKENHGILIDKSSLPMSDAKTLSLLSSGDTDGCFQLENYGMKNALRQINIDSFEDLVVAIAMYRPGPKDYIPEYARRKKNPQSVKYAHPIVEKHTKDTYGIVCYQEDTKVSLSDGRHIPIKNMKKGEIVHSYNVETKRMEPQICDGCAPTSVGCGFHIKLKNGYEITVTPDHEIWTFEGMVKCKDLKIGDLVGCPLSVPDTNERKILNEELGTNESVAYLLGLLTGDGNISRGVSISCGSKTNNSLINKWINTNIPSLISREYEHGSWHISLYSSELLNCLDYGNRKTKWHFFLEQLGMKKNCYNKRIPDDIMSNDIETKCSYLAGLIDSDGHLSTSSNGQCICHYTSVNKKLLKDLCRLLQSLGISHQYRDLRVHIWDTQKLYDKINKYLVVRKFSGKLSSGIYSSYIPKQTVLNSIKNSKISQRSYCDKHKINRSNLRLKNKYCTTYMANKIGIDLGDLRYYPIVSIEKVYNQQFYGMSVRKNHNLVANGIVAKNCYQEQAMFVFVELADLTSTEGYTFIKGSAKKDPELFMSMKDRFIRGASKKANVKIAEDIWKQFEPFQGYAFNRSLSHDQKIITSKNEYTIQQLYKMKDDIDSLPQVYSSEGKLIDIVDVYDHGVLPVFEIEFSDGSKHSCTINHKFLTPFGPKPVYEILSSDLTIVKQTGVFNAQEKRLDLSRVSDIISQPKKSVQPFENLLALSNFKKISDWSPTKGSLCMSRLSRRDFRRKKVRYSQKSLREMEIIENEKSFDTVKKVLGNSLFRRRTSESISQNNVKFCFEIDSCKSRRKKETIRIIETFERNTLLCISRIKNKHCNKNIGKKRHTNKTCRNTKKLETKQSRRFFEQMYRSCYETKKVAVGSGNFPKENFSSFRFQTLPDHQKPNVFICFEEKADRFYRQRSKSSHRIRRGVSFPESFRQRLVEKSTERRRSQQVFEKSRILGDKNFVRLLDVSSQKIKNCSISTNAASRFILPRQGSCKNDWQEIRISSVKFIGYEQCYDLEVDSNDHLYCLSSGIVNSNSHAVSYAHESWVTSYLKAHYRLEFMSARMSVEAARRNFEDVEKYENDLINYGVKILPPDLNKSKMQYSIVDEKTIRRPLILKDVGEKAVQEIINNQPFIGNDFLYSFFSAVGSSVNHKTVEALWNSKLFGDISKKKVLEAYDIIRKDKQKAKGRQIGDLFS